MSPSTLKLQLVKEVATLGGLTQEEAEKAMELKPMTPYKGPAPAKRDFRPPSTIEWKLLSRVAAYPRLATEVDLSPVDTTLEESKLLADLCEHLKGNAGTENLSNPMMIEVFKDSPRAELLFQAQAFGLELAESEDDSRHFVRHTIWKLEIGQKKKEIRSLEERLRQGLLSKEEHRHYATLISEVPLLERKLQADARGTSQGIG
jgi:hypothetical protein